MRIRQIGFLVMKEISMSKTIRALQLEKIKQAENRLKTRKQKIIHSIRTEQRKEDTRRKILLGSVMLKAASESKPSRIQIKQMVADMNERDQKVFEPLFETWLNQS